MLGTTLSYPCDLITYGTAIWRLDAPREKACERIDVLGPYQRVNNPQAV